MPISSKRTARMAKNRAGRASTCCARSRSGVEWLRLGECRPDADFVHPHGRLSCPSPIVLSESANWLDIFSPPDRYGLDRRSYAQVVQYGKLYRYNGRARSSLSSPEPAMEWQTAGRSHRSAAPSPAGGAHAPLQVTTYPVVNRDLASPIRLSFIGLKAKVADPCGQWPGDLASGSSLQGWQNKPYWNFGCSYQSIFAAQVADPRDLVGPRAEDPSDTVSPDLCDRSNSRGQRSVDDLEYQWDHHQSSAEWVRDCISS